MKLIAKQDIEIAGKHVHKGQEIECEPGRAAALIAHGYAVAADSSSETAQAPAAPETAARKPASGGKTAAAKAAPISAPNS